MLLKHLIFLLALAHFTLGAYQIVKVSNLQNGGQVRNYTELSWNLFTTPLLLHHA